MKKIKHFELLLVLTIVFFLGGLIFPPFFIVSGLIAWFIFGETFSASPNPDGTWPDVNTRRQSNADQHRDTALLLRCYNATAADPKWKSYYLEVCESPAESGFLEAMIEAYELKPEKGVLRGGGVALSLQVVLEPYRADFMIDNWLIVEIDGAAYHSAPEAVARDQKRDRDLKRKGFSVLRIPAKIVFTSPSEAINRVRASFALGRQSSGETVESVGEKEDPTKKAPHGFFSSAANSLNGVLDTINEISATVDVLTAVKRERESITAVYNTERSIIDAVIGGAEFSLNAKSLTPEEAELLNQTLRLLGGIEKTTDPYLDEKIREFKAAAIVVVESKRLPNPNPTIEAAILEARKAIAKERIEYIRTVRARLDGNAKLAELVKQTLHDVGCGIIWRNFE